MIWNIPRKPMQPSDLNYTEYLNMTFSCQTNRTTRKEQYIICIVQNEALKKSKLLPDARLGDLLMKCQITKYIYHLLFFFFNSINDYPVKKNPNPDTTVINAKWSFFSWACATYKCRTIKAWGQICQTSIPQPNRICKPMY